ncbi:MAG: peptide chain release factor N(5)-glutamine methyltransferase [Gemmatimonadota bacterium]|nr:peptide chain release factor N(5)-glutamine methyltransferase [Gemmatimonadota bacterium]
MNGSVPDTARRVWTVMEVIRVSADYLTAKGVDDGRLNAEQLLAHVLRTERLQLYLHFDRPLDEEELARYKQLLRRRAAREPLQYVLGTAQFRTLELQVDHRVAIPRPETEYMIDVLLRITGRRRFDAALDVGTGSGAIALALAAEGIARSVFATDVSTAALDAARQNAIAAGVDGVEFRGGHLLGPFEGRTFDLVLSNPPYLAEADWLATEPEIHEWEPRLAMVATESGLGVIRSLIDGLDGFLRPGGWIGLEVGCEQATPVAALMEACPGFEVVQVHDDLAGRPRYVFARQFAGARNGIGDR